VAALNKLSELEPSKKRHRDQLESIESSPDLFATFASMDTSNRDEIESVTSDSAEFSTELLQDVMSQHPEFRAAQIRLLEDLISSQPAYIEGRIKLKRHYLEAGSPEKAIAQCEEIAALYTSKGEETRARGFADEAEWLRSQFLGVEATVSDRTPPPVQIVVEAPVATVEPTATDIVIRIPLEKFLAREYGRAAREMTSLSIVKIRVEPLDKLVSFDQIFVALESALHRPADIVVSCGNAEFLAVMPDTHAKGAEVLAERFVSFVEELGNVRARAGVASTVPQSTGSPMDLLAEADSALRVATANDETTVDTASA
jgi:hypothetical protein